MAEYIQISTTTASRQEAEKIADALLGQRLAACVWISPVSSRYRWQGNIEKDNEFLCVIKSRKRLFGAVEEVICKLHSYDVPEILAVPVVAIASGYEDWLNRELDNGG